MKEIIAFMFGIVEVHGWVTGGASIARVVLGLGLPHIVFITAAIVITYVAFLKWKRLHGATERYREDSWSRGQC